jgi:methylisocitrate lyase
MLLVLPKDPEEAKAIGERVEGPLFYLMLGGITSMGASLEELGQLGYKLIVDPLTPFYAGTRALRRSYDALAQGVLDPTVQGEYREEDRYVHAAIDLERMLDVERRTVEPPASG